MTENLNLSRKARHGDSTAYLTMLLNNDREQLVSYVADSNPEVYFAFRDVFEGENNQSLARFIVTNWRSKRLKLPKMDFMPREDGHSYENITRYASAKKLDKIKE